ncbi:hypothetical protein Desku_2793 [Desulfofundulus kuznetsovii DSM 6115]|uniref:DUF3307 domain-containing protein n=1 Tax=Desulfofundulus kuznetsovii (strain DSM 6115 / VKM B-1805 / 17) TaxID=760568 RepID=A0AAU8PDZ5_DESK7|nr:hypothetical protein Desku_2793 [Desulfofundulus kuznetsovii DSM 6115]
MNLFSWLLVGHLIGDFLLQTRWMAEGKIRHWFPLVVHALVYTAAVYLSSLLAGGLSLPATALVFLAHLVLDRRLLVDFWARRITGTVDIPWLSVIIDQSWHVVVLAVATLL